MNKIKVPEGMLKASDDALHNKKTGSVEQVIIEAALQWLSENPIVPTNQQMQELWQSISGVPNFHKKELMAAIAEWQRKMFLETKDNSAIKDLLYEANPFPNMGAKHRHDEAVIEAYWRGKEGK